MCGRWDTMCMPMTDCKTITQSSWMSNRTCYLMWQMIHDIVPWLFMSNILCISPVSSTKHQGHLPMVIDWAPTTGVIPCQVKPGHAYGQQIQGKTVLIELEFGGVEQNLIPNVWQLVFANVPV